MMKRTPCEYVIWNGLPVIRKEIAACMITKFGLNQKEAAEKLSITPAAVCQYLAHKRGNFVINDTDLIKEITDSAERLITNADSSVIEETCRICRLFIAKGIFHPACPSCTPPE
jgi:predicted transcriptional regulator